MVEVVVAGLCHFVFFWVAVFGCQENSRKVGFLFFIFNFI